MTKRRLIKRLWPQSLTAQLVCLLLGAIILTHIVLGVMLAEERRDAVASERRGYALSRVAAISRILTTTPRDNWADVLRVAQSSQNRLRLVPETDLQAGDGFVSDSLTHRLNEALSLENGIPARVEILSEDDCWDERKSLRRDKEDYLERNYPQRPDDDDEDDDQGKRVDDHHHRDDDRRAPWSMRYLDRFDCHTAPVMRLVVPVNMIGTNGEPTGTEPDVWLEAMIGGVMPPPWFVFDNLLRVLASGLVIAVIAFFLARRISRSWDVLTRAADRVGRGDYPEPVPETGPIEIRRATKAFNRMTARLKRFVEDRTRMLAAISHDLRTPITSLRLRAEFVEDPENRARIIETLDEMEQMVEAAMTFAREETANEETRKIDLTALVESAVEDLAETGRPITFIGQGATRVYPCRPLSIKRAFGNLVANALNFGHTVEVAVRDADDGGLWIEIADDGPGIPVEQREQVFEPFFRIEESRNRDTGGIGLGMAIARTAIRAHGGEIYLEESQKGGLLARIYLPPAQPQ
ncbi:MULTISPECIES: ATP-binding protein [Thalassospira]|uniref:histidine kinase n=1 Tax=Thalassospira profundimaris TaxID=502049 RepID=A0A367V6S9_9PROT|nr:MULTISPECIES: ATP-binding protein [Thalassospira]KZB70453.1 histidine kinase [Thalassospira sp. MCCC 1A01148]MBR9901762.1 HAMP domain-containing protein [Rhodospirillales bacterium]RCK20904.1 histidine kinase [Thalassospira profundimaris]